LIGLFHFHDAEISSPTRPHEYQMAGPTNCSTWQNIQCANRGALRPTVNPMLALLVLLISITQNPVDHAWFLEFLPEYLPSIHRFHDVIIGHMPKNVLH